MAKITFVAGEVFPPELLVRNKALNNGHGHPFERMAVSPGTKLAVVGGGPQIAEHVSKLKAWDGEIWAINGAFGWCLDRGIEATFYTLDSLGDLAPLAARATKAVLADCCSPMVREAVSGAAYMVDMAATAKGCTSAATSPMLAATAGYESVTLFGCESSFDDVEHAYPWAFVTESRVLVECGGEQYLTTPQLIMQAEYIAEIAQALPGYLRVEGRGFLPALIKNGDYSVLQISRDLAEAV